MHRIAGLLVALAILTTVGPAGGSDLYADGPYREDLPRPEVFLGYELGTLHTHHFRIEAYFEALAAAAPERMRLMAYGESHERKRLFIAVVTSEENLAEIDELRSRNRLLAEPRSTSREEAAQVASSNPVFVWLDYGNDGNESAAAEAAMQVAYQMVAGESDEMRRLRQEAVILIEPDHNPESHDRHVAWYNAFGVGDPEPLAMEHHAPWGMSTNNNHYQIDLNRDAWGLTQRENQAIAAEILRWRPQVFVDHHGQTENYFFAPPVLPINPSLPASHLRWYEIFGRGNAAAFDARGWQYYVRDVFDLFYPGYWDSWPALHGAIGMTYETDGGGSRGLAWRRRDGSIVTFRDAIARHFTASLATLRTAAGNREQLLLDFHAFFSDALKAGLEGRPVRAYLVDSRPDPRRSAALIATLLRHGVEVRRLTEPLSADGESLLTGRRQSLRLPAGAYLVDMAQPEQRSAETFLGRDAKMDPEFVQRQLARWSRNARKGEKAPRERYEFYDLTSWSLPLAFGVNTIALDELPAAASEPIGPDPDRLAGSGGWEDEISFTLTGLEAGVTTRISGADATAQPAAAPPSPARSAYIFRPESEGASRLVAGLLREGFRVAVSLAAPEAGAESFPRGSFIVQVDRNPEIVHQRIAELAADAAVEVVASDTAFPAGGQTGVGSNAVVGLRAPRIAMIADEGIRITGYGAAWFTLERRIGYPFTPLRFNELRRADLDTVDVLVLPDGPVSAFRRALGEDGLEKLGGWLDRGGTLVGWGEGPMELAVEAEWVSSSFAGSDPASGAEDRELETSAQLAEIDALAAAEQPPGVAISPTADPGGPQPIPGAVVAARLDLSHWLTVGFTDPFLPVLVDGDRILELSRSGENPVVYASEEDLPISGFLWPGNSARWLAGRAAVVVEPRGRGQVILFAHDPNFRLVWRSTSRLFANALLLGPTLGTRTSHGM